MRSRRRPPEDLPTAKTHPITLKRLEVTRPPNTYLLLISYRLHQPAPRRGRRQRYCRTLIWSIPTTSASSPTSGVSHFMEKQTGGSESQNGTLQHRPGPV